MTGWRPAIIADVTIRALLFSVPLNLICYFAGGVVARSGGVMRAIESLLIAYCMAGLYHVLCNLRQPKSWSRLSEQFFRFDKWSLCRG